MAAADKVRYENEMKDYVPPKGGVDTASSSNKNKKGKVQKKDPNAPKKPLSSFMIFSNEVRAQIKKDHPEMTFGELGKKIGELFRALSSDKKLKYEDLAKKEKEKYKQAMIAFENKKQGATKDNDDDEDDDDDDDDGLDDEDDEDDDDDDDE